MTNVDRIRALRTARACSEFIEILVTTGLSDKEAAAFLSVDASVVAEIAEIEPESVTIEEIQRFSTILRDVRRPLAVVDHEDLVPA